MGTGAGMGRIGWAPRAQQGAAIVALTVLGACAGGGGGGGGAATSNPTPPINNPTPAPANYPLASSAEYQENWGLGAINAEAAFAYGATGAGVIVGVIDTGVNASQPDLAANISPQSTDIIAGRDQPSGVNLHATFVASIIAATFNGQGTVGVAYDSTILSVRADSAGSCSGQTSTDCSFDDVDLANGISYAVAHGAKVINLSVGGTTPDSVPFQQALSKAVAAGVVFAIAAGNEGAANPDWPAAYATDPRYQGAILAVGALTQAGALASYSNQAGSAAADYVVAPGDNITTACTGTSCWQVSGTSFAAPHVAGALALLLQAFPNLSGQQAVAILLKTTDDLGATGVDAVYGDGLIDLGKAFSPIGALSVPTANGGNVSVSTTQSSSPTILSPAFGDAVARSQALTTVGYDDYQRLFVVNLATGYRSAPRAPALQGSALSERQASVVISGANGSRLELTSGAADHSLESDLDPTGVMEGLRMAEAPLADINLSFTAGRFNFQAWSGQGGMAPAGDLAASRDAFASLSKPDHAARAGLSFGPLQVSAEAGGGSPFSLYGLNDLPASSYMLSSLKFADPRLTASLSAGRLTEPLGPLGSFLPQTTINAMPASTGFVSGQLDWKALPLLALSAQASVGQSSGTGEQLRLQSGATSTTWRLAAQSLCPAGAGGCTQFSASIDQPIRLEAGQFTAVLADVPASYFDPLHFSTRTLSASPSGRQLDFRLGMDRDFARLGHLQLQAVAITDENNEVGTPLNLGLLASWRSSF